MTTYRSQIAETEAHFSSTSRGGAVPLTPQELMALFTKLNEGFMGLAARLHVVHEAVSSNMRDSYVTYLWLNVNVVY